MFTIPLERPPKTPCWGEVCSKSDSWQKKILILSFTDANRDPRVLRQIKYFLAHYHVLVAGLNCPSFIKHQNFLPIVRKSKRSLGEVWRAATLLMGFNSPARERFYLVNPFPQQTFDAVICNDAEPLPMAFKLAQGAPVLFDAHEYYPLEFESSIKWRLLMQRNLIALCRQYITRCAGMSTVGSQIAQRYAQEFGVLPVVVHSGPEFHSLEPRPVNAECIRMVHHGVANADRQLHLMLDVMRHVDARFKLDIYLVGDAQYIAALRARYADVPSIVWREPLPMENISAVLNGYDLGLYILAATGFNNLYALPNKFFEFIQARIGIATGPSPEMAAMTREHSLGIVAESFTAESMAQALNALTESQIMSFKQQAHAAAQVFHAARSMENMHTLLAQCMGDS